MSLTQKWSRFIARSILCQTFDINFSCHVDAHQLYSIHYAHYAYSRYRYLDVGI